MPHRVRSAVADPARPVIEVPAGHRTYALLPVAASDLGFTTIYGTDVTALKALDKFPDQNPNPVLRVSQDGRLIYANPASAAIRESFGVRVGEALPAGVFRRITERLDPAIDDVMEVVAGELVFSILVRSINEFGFINLYGTDVTAARQVERANELNRRLLLNILPERIADQLQAGATVIAERFDDVTLLFADIVDFTPMSSRMSATEVVDVLNARLQHVRRPRRASRAREDQDDRRRVHGGRWPARPAARPLRAGSHDGARAARPKSKPSRSRGTTPSGSESA